MAKKETSKRSTAAKKTDRNLPPPPPKKNGEEALEVQRSGNSSALGGLIFLVLAICSTICYFNTDGSLVAFFSDWLVV